MKLRENQKVTLTLGQLKKLVKESYADDAEENEAADDFNKYLDFGCKVLMFGIEAHIWHLNCESNAAHLALKDLYESCDDLGDQLLEATLGITGGYIENKAGSNEYEFGDLRYASETAIAKINELTREAQDLIDGCDDSGIENILADFCETCNSVVYKLKRLK